MNTEQWCTRYVENGGYDSMTDAIEIYRGERLIAVIDLANYGQDHCDRPSKEMRQEAEADAMFLVEAANVVIRRGLQ